MAQFRSLTLIGAILAFVAPLGYAHEHEHENGWKEAVLKPPVVNGKDQFGHAVVTDGSVLIVSAVGDSLDFGGVHLGDRPPEHPRSPMWEETGAVYVFRRARSGDWKLIAFIKAPFLDARDRFGCSLALYGNTFVVGAPEDDGNYNGIYNVQSHRGKNPTFNEHVNNKGDNNGAVYVYRIEGDQVSLEALVKPKMVQFDQQFGTAVAIRGDILAVGVPRDSYQHAGVVPLWVHGRRKFFKDIDSKPLRFSGAVYTYKRVLGQWRFDDYLKPINPASLQQFGASVAIDAANRLIVGAPGDSTGVAGINPEPDADVEQVARSGAVYIFERSDKDFLQTHYIKSRKPGLSATFGRHVVALPDGFAAAEGVSDPDEKGMVFVYSIDRFSIGAKAVELRDVIVPSVHHPQNFVSALSYSGNTLAIGSESDDNWEQSESTVYNDEMGHKYDAGAAYVFRKRDGEYDFQEKNYLKPRYTEPWLHFGHAVAVGSDSMLAVGVPGDRSTRPGLHKEYIPNGVFFKDGPYQDSGAVYVYEKSSAGGTSRPKHDEL